MKRRELREHIFKALFQVDFHPKEEALEKVNTYIDKIEDLNDDDLEFISNITNGVISNIEEIDKFINDKSKGWTTKRMANVDLTIIRISVFEIFFLKNIAKEISINEAVEIAKKYSTDNSSSFVNGLLGDMVRG